MANESKKGAGSFRERSDGSWEYTVGIGYEMGKRRRKSFYGKTKSACLKAYNKYKLITKEEKHTAVEEKKAITTAEWLDKWLEVYKKDNVSDSTYEDYGYLIAHVKKNVIADMPLADVNPIDVTAFFKSIGEYSHSTRKKAKFLLSAAFEAAIDNKHCDRNPVRRAEFAKKLPPEREAFTQDEARIITDFAKTDKHFGVAAYIMMHTGVRSGEMRGMTVSQIDLKRGVITIDRAIKHTEEPGLPKNNKARYIPLEDEVIAFLSENIDTNDKYLIGKSHYVSRAGFRSRYLHFFNRMNKHLISSGKEPIPFKSAHATRHTFGTIRQKNGMPIAMVAALLGHSSTDVTDKYTHLSDVTTLTEAVKKYDFLG